MHLGCGTFGKIRPKGGPLWGIAWFSFCDSVSAPRLWRYSAPSYTLHTATQRFLCLGPIGQDLQGIQFRHATSPVGISFRRTTFPMPRLGYPGLQLRHTTFPMPRPGYPIQAHYLPYAWAWVSNRTNHFPHAWAGKSKLGTVPSLFLPFRHSFSMCLRVRAQHVLCV